MSLHERRDFRDLLGSDIQAALALEYEQSRFLYYGGFPTFDEIHARLDRYREIL